MKGYLLDVPSIVFPGSVALRFVAPAEATVVLLGVTREEDHDSD